MTYASTGHKKTQRGLDDGSSTTTKSKKRRQNPDEKAPPPPKEAGAQPAARKLTEVPKILPGERMGDYAARVDQALPVAGLVNKGSKKGVAGERRQQSRMEKRMQKMQKEWREEEARRKAKLEEQKEEEEEEDQEHGFEVNDQRSSSGKTKKGKRRRRKSQEDEDEDPWAVVAANRKREQEEKEKEKEKEKDGKGKGKGLVGLHDVVHAPPKFERVPKAKVSLGDAMRKGGLKKQVEMSEARKSVIEEYRRMMRERRGEQQIAS
ncbi:MAG: hypothetical protein Q9216_006891 [Gyalolechia sp. 2 TL-2023]